MASGLPNDPAVVRRIPGADGSWTSFDFHMRRLGLAKSAGGAHACPHTGARRRVSAGKVGVNFDGAAAADAALWMITTGIALVFILKGKV
jgi:hypothetical protein